MAWLQLIEIYVCLKQIREYFYMLGFVIWQEICLQMWMKFPEKMLGTVAPFFDPSTWGVGQRQADLCLHSEFKAVRAMCETMSKKQTKSLNQNKINKQTKLH